MAKSYEITLPLPPKELSPNARVHWAVKATAVKGYRALAWAEAKRIIGREAAPKWKNATAQATFYFTKVARRDKDNFQAMLKPAFDGIRDSGIIDDDKGGEGKSGFTPLPPIFAPIGDCGKVVIVIKEV
jgi:crossover junction endodeoxyribonuclease RusA